jgi:hypothetical protein
MKELITLLNSGNKSEFFFARTGTGKTEAAIKLIAHALTKDEIPTTLIYSAKKRLELCEVILRLRRLLIELKGANNADRYLDKLFIKFNAKEMKQEDIDTLMLSDSWSKTEKNYINKLIHANKIVSQVRYTNDKNALLNSKVILTTHESLPALTLLRKANKDTVLIIDEVPQHFFNILGSTQYSAKSIISQTKSLSKDDFAKWGTWSRKDIRPCLESNIYIISKVKKLAVMHLNANHDYAKVIVMSGSCDTLFLYNKLLPNKMNINDSEKNLESIERFFKRVQIKVVKKGSNDARNEQQQAILDTMNFNCDCLVINPASLTINGGTQIPTNFTGSNSYRTFTRVLVASQLNLMPELRTQLATVMNDDDLTKYEAVRSGAMLIQSIYRSNLRESTDKTVYIEFISKLARFRVEGYMCSLKDLMK